MYSRPGQWASVRVHTASVPGSACARQTQVAVSSLVGGGGGTDDQSVVGKFIARQRVFHPSVHKKKEKKKKKRAGDGWTGDLAARSGSFSFFFSLRLPINSSQGCVFCAPTKQIISSGCCSPLSSPRSRRHPPPNANDLLCSPPSSMFPAVLCPD